MSRRLNRMRVKRKNKKNIIIILILTGIVRYSGFLVSIAFLARCAYVYKPLLLQK